jgi:hypothetical protein
MALSEPQKRVPHPSRLYREGWVIRATREPFSSNPTPKIANFALPLPVLLSRNHGIVISTEAQRSGEICFSTQTSSKLSSQSLLYDLLTCQSIASISSQKGGIYQMPNVHGIEFNANQSELVKDLVRELLKDGNCAVYGLNNMRPNGELRMASTPPAPTPREVGGVFLRIRPGEREAIIVRPMNAKAGEKYIPVSKLTQAQTLAVIRTWRKQTGSLPVQPPTASAGPQLVFAAGKKKNHHGQ